MQQLLACLFFLALQPYGGFDGIGLFASVVLLVTTSSLSVELCSVVGLVLVHFSRLSALEARKVGVMKSEDAHRLSLSLSVYPGRKIHVFFMFLPGMTSCEESIEVESRVDVPKKVKAIIRVL